MTAPWPKVALGEVLTHYQDYIDAPEPKVYPKLSVRLYGKGVVLDGPADGSQLKMKRHQIARAGQVILSEIWGKKGAIGFVPVNGDGALCTSHFFLFDVQTEELIPKYLQAVFTANYLQGQLDADAQGTTGYAAVRPKNLLAAKIPLPPLCEQRRIVARIEELAARVEEARGLRRQAVEEADALRNSAAAMLFHELCCERRSVRSFVSIVGGGTPSKSNPYYWGGNIPWVTPKDMKVREISDSIDHITEEASRESSAKLIKPDAVLVVVRGMILAHTFPSAMLRVPATINQDMKALRTNDTILPEYLCSVFWGLNRDLLELVEKSTHDTRKFETDKLLNFEIPVPPVQEQRHIIAYLDGLQLKVGALTELQAETAAELDALLPSILDKAFNGEL